MDNQNIVSFRAACFLKEELDYSEQTIYVYDCGFLKISCEPDILNPIPAPEILNAVDYLKKFGIYIYYYPEKDGTLRGVISIGNNKYRMKKSVGSVYEVYNKCLNFVTNFFKK